MRTVKLSRCAHCGDKDVMLLRTIHDNTVFWHVECRNCGMKTTEYPESLPTVNDTVDHVIGFMDETIDTAVGVWNTRVESCPSASIELEGKSNDELVAIAKECQDVLGRKAMKLLERMKEIMEEDNNG